MTTKGRAFLLYMGPTNFVVPSSGRVSLSTWALVGGAQERSVDINTEIVDGTVAPATLTAPVWSEPLAGAKSVIINCSARFLNEAAERRILDAVVSGNALSCLLVYPTSDSPVSELFGSQLAGRFQVTSMSMSGSLTDTFNWSLTLASVGRVHHAPPASTRSLHYWWGTSGTADPTMADLDGGQAVAIPGHRLSVPIAGGTNSVSLWLYIALPTDLRFVRLSDGTLDWLSQSAAMHFDDTDVDVEDSGMVEYNVYRSNMALRDAADDFDVVFDVVVDDV